MVSGVTRRAGARRYPKSELRRRPVPPTLGRAAENDDQVHGLDLGVRSQVYRRGVSITSAARTGMSVSELAKQVGLGGDTIRYYERIGLIPPARRTPAEHRRYDEDAIEALLACSVLLGLVLNPHTGPVVGPTTSPQARDRLLRHP